MNVPGGGPAGPARSTGDSSDFYRINLLAGQTIKLQISDFDPGNPVETDIDLLLLNLNEELVDKLAGSTLDSVETLVVEVSGEFVIVVSACYQIVDPAITVCGNGGSNYVLTVGQASTAEVTASFQLSNDFIPGQAVAHLIPSQPDSPQQFAAASALGQGNEDPGLQLIQFSNTAGLAAAPQPDSLPDNIPRFKVREDLADRMLISQSGPAKCCFPKGNQRFWIFLSDYFSSWTVKKRN